MKKNYFFLYFLYLDKYPNLSIKNFLILYCLYIFQYKVSYMKEWNVRKNLQIFFNRKSWNWIINNIFYYIMKIFYL